MVINIRHAVGFENNNGTHPLEFIDNSLLEAGGKNHIRMKCGDSFQRRGKKSSNNWFQGGLRGISGVVGHSHDGPAASHAKNHLGHGGHQANHPAGGMLQCEGMAR